MLFKGVHLIIYDQILLDMSKNIKICYYIWLMRGGYTIELYNRQNQMLMSPMLNNNNPYTYSALNNFNPNTFHFYGTCLSFQSRVDSMPDQQINRIADATIMMSGLQIKQVNSFCCILTLICGSIFLLPFLFVCCQWWKKFTYPAYDIPLSVYNSLSRLVKNGNLRNLTLYVRDNTFDEQKANLIYQMVDRSTLRGLTIVNSAGSYDYNGRQYTDFDRNMLPIKQLSEIISDIRWQNNDCAASSVDHQYV